MLRSLKAAWLAWRMDRLKCRAFMTKCHINRWQVELQLTEFALAKGKEEQEAAVDKLPKCWRLDKHGKLVQDVPVVPEMDVWVNDDKRGPRCCEVTEVRACNIVILNFHGKYDGSWEPTDCYSTREAAELAAKQTDTPPNADVMESVEPA